MNSEAIVALWEEMATSPKSSGVTRRLLATDAPIDVYACVFWPENKLGFWIQLEGSGLKIGGAIPRCRGVEMELSELPDGGGIAALSVRLEQTRYVDIFSVLSADLINSALSAKTIDASVTECIGRLSQWQYLFGEDASQAFGDRKQRGLIGELIFIRDYALPNMPTMAAIDGWKGFDAKSKDFDFGAVAVETKTSITKKHTKISIANEKQLDSQHHEMLLMHLIRLDEVSRGGISLHSLVTNLRSELAMNPIALSALNHKLLAFGYLDAHSENYLNQYKILDGTFFEVRDHFPRLTEGNLPKGVGDVSYTIILDQLSEFEVDQIKVSKLLKG